MKSSVIISTFNGENYILEELESICHQSVAPDEVLISDDASSDSTEEMVADFINEHNFSNWFIISNNVNKGWKRNFMEAIDEATGDIVFIADQDDIWMNNKIELMKNTMESNSNINLLVSNYEAFYENGKTHIGPGVQDNLMEKQEIKYDLFNIKYPGCTYCVRKAFFDKCFEFWEPDFPHDAFLWRSALALDSLYSLNIPLIKWRRHKDSAFAKESAAKKTIESKTQWIDYALRSLNSLEKFSTKYGGSTINEVILKNEKWCKLRLKLYQQKNLIDWFKLLRYRDCYSRVKQYFGDLYLAFFTSG